MFSPDVTNMMGSLAMVRARHGHNVRGGNFDRASNLVDVFVEKTTELLARLEVEAPNSPAWAAGFFMSLPLDARYVFDGRRVIEIMQGNLRVISETSTCAKLMNDIIDCFGVFIAEHEDSLVLSTSR